MLPLNDSSITALSRVSQASVAPVFMLTGIGSILGVLANRLGRRRGRVRSRRPRGSVMRGAAPSCSIA